MEKIFNVIFALIISFNHVRAEERINHEGRILGVTLAITNAILFNTPEADAVVSTLQMFPADNNFSTQLKYHLVAAQGTCEKMDS